MPPPRQTGPLAFDDLLALFKSGADEGYYGTLLKAEDGEALVGQMLKQFGLVSRAIDETFQSLFIVPWSGQTADPASGPHRSTLVLTVERASAFDIPLVFVPGALRAEEVADDFGPSGPVPARTGRIYASKQIQGLMPGRTSIGALLEAERPGKGYDLPRPGSIRAFSQPGGGLTNDRATAIPDQPLHRLVAAPRADAPVPENVGSYVRLLVGANAGRILRVVGYGPPAEDGSTGGTLLLAATGVFGLSSMTGAFRPGERIEQPASGAEGVFLMADVDRLVLDRLSGTFVLGQPVEGATTGAQAIFSVVEQDPEIVAETETASWQILRWAEDLGLFCSNELSPRGGRAPTLQEIGFERGLHQEANETEEAFRRRVFEIADTISPSAVRRAVNRVLARTNREGYVREVGRLDFRGVFYDGDPSSSYADDAFFYDEPDPRVRPLHVALSYEEFRGFFLVEIPYGGDGDFGIAYDAGASNAYDTSPWLAFYDGFAIGSAIEAREIARVVDRTRAAGVGFDLVRVRPPGPAIAPTT